MSFNLLLKRYVEAEINNKTNVDGKWRVEVVCPNGQVKKPLGDKWRKNLIQDRGLNYINGTWSTSFIASYTAQGRSIDNFAYSALFSDSSSEPFSVNNAKQIGANENTYWTKRLTSNVDENTNPYIDDENEGSRTFRRAWDFPSLVAGETKTIREILITSSSYGSTSTAADQVKGSEYPLITSYPVISRFVLPEPITLTEFQFLRLYYSIKVTVPSIVNPVELTLESGDFDATGQLKLVGEWSRIFSGAGHYWRYRTYTNFTVTEQPWCPWSLIGREGCSALIVKGNADPNLNYNFPAINVDSPILYNMLYSDTQTVTHATPGGSINPGTDNQAELTVVNNSVSREATLLFQANNPSVEDPLGGIIIMPLGTANYTMTGGSIPVYTAPGTSINEVAAGGYFWYWRFTDETFSSPRSVVKDRNYGLAINLTQTMTRG